LRRSLGDDDYDMADEHPGLDAAGITSGGLLLNRPRRSCTILPLTVISRQILVSE
jgi:hypothetical protein